VARKVNLRRIVIVPAVEAAAAATVVLAFHPRLFLTLAATLVKKTSAIRRLQK
jgi:hypothetical protein